MKLFSDWIALLVGIPIELPTEFLTRWPELRAGRFRRGGLPPRVGGWCLGTRTVAGIALGRTIWIAGSAAMDPELLLHEVRHLQQACQVRAFPLRYVWESMRRGYAGNRFETDARQYASARTRDSDGSAG